MENEETLYCEFCEEIIENLDDAFITNDRKTVCRECVENYFFHCEGCEELYHQDEACHSDYDGIFCNDCYCERFARCENCNAEIERDYAEWRDDACLCRECADEYDRENTDEMSVDIFEYHGFKNWKPKSANGEEIKDDTIFIGFELEVENQGGEQSNDTTARTVKNILEKNVVCAEDGSLDDGFEIISHPFTYKKYEELKPKFIEAFDYLIESSFNSHDTTTCGLHFHVGRKALGETKEAQDNTINKIMLILENFKSELVQFSRRTQETLQHWSNFISDKVSEDNKKLIYSIEWIKKNKNGHNRYMALNLQNENTIEFRFIRGTLNINTFYASVQLINTIVLLARDKNIEELKGLTFGQICRYFDYEELKSYLNYRGIHSKNRLKEYSDEYFKIERQKHKEEEKKEREHLKELAKLEEKVKKAIEICLKNFDRIANAKEKLQNYTCKKMFEIWEQAKFCDSYVSLMNETAKLENLNELYRAYDSLMSIKDRLTYNMFNPFRKLDGNIIKIIDDYEANNILCRFERIERALKIIEELESEGVL